ncbi:MAG: group II intron reverse transcriptase/maturase [Bacteroidales bacterium]
MLERIVSKENMLEAFNRVVGNKGSAGVDNMSVYELKAHLQTHWTEIKRTILDGSYRPEMVLGIEIDKPRGGKRLLGIPTVLDRMIQQAIQQELNQYFDPGFSRFSYGFRKGKSAHQAIKQALSYANTGSKYVVDIDLSKFFDRVNHDYLMGLLSKEIHDKCLLSLIRRYLQSGILLDGLTSKRTEGTPQGSPLSPLLSNIILNELDKELEKRKHRFVRYADDFSIYVKTKRSAHRVMRSISRFVGNRLKLKVNVQKSAVRYVGHMELLGYGIYRMRNQKFGLKVIESNWQKFVRKCKSITRKSRPISYDERVNELKVLCNGWIGYFRYANIQTRLTGLDRLLGSRLRYCIWKSWKRIRTRIRNLIKLGLPEWLAVKWGFTRRGGWHVVQSPILQTTLTNERLQKRGFVPTYSIYKRFSHV